MKDFPRRNRLDLCTPAERAIFNAMTEVEFAGANEMLTGAIVKLKEAKELVSDFVDGISVKPIGFIERLIDEKTELDVKAAKLESFLSAGKFQDVEEVQVSLLRIQLSAMQVYSQCLLERLIWLQKI